MSILFSGISIDYLALSKSIFTSSFALSLGGLFDCLFGFLGLFRFFGDVFRALGGLGGRRRVGISMAYSIACTF
jgi:hypothetical protein